MLKTIHLIRHAKSSWDNPRLTDIERPLSDRGISSCKIMAPAINAAGCSFQNVFCSPAARAQATIKGIAHCLPMLDIQWQTDNDLYCFDSARLFDWCQLLEDDIEELAIVGHNPALTDFCNALGAHNIKNIPTCAYAQLTATERCRWSDIDRTPFKLREFIRPKDLRR